MRDVKDEDTAKFWARRVARMALLNPEQRKVAERWERERDERLRLLGEAKAAEARGDDETRLALWKKVCTIGAEDSCEHGRSVYSTCMACEEIERILSPELFEDEDE